MSKKKMHVLILSDEDKKRLTIIVHKVITMIQVTKNIEEQAFILRILMETFEESQNCTVPFKNRYTEPVYNYQENGAGK